MEYSSNNGKKPDLLLMLGLNDTIHQLAMANTVCWYSEERIVMCSEERMVMS